MSPEFRILPWDYDASVTQLAAHAVEQATLGGIESNFLIKCVQDRLYFRRAENPEQTFAIATPYTNKALLTEEEQHQMVAFWRDHLAQEDMVRYESHGHWKRIDDKQGSGFIVTSSDPREYVSHFDKVTNVAVLFRADNGGWAREWWGGEWIPFEGEPDLNIVPIWQKNWRSVYVYKTLEKVWPHLLSQNFDATVRNNLQLKWVQGSHAEWQQVMHAYLIHVGDSEFNSYLSVSMPSIFDGKNSADERPHRFSIIVPAWSTIFDDYFRVSPGVLIDPKHANPTDCRSDWYITSPVFQIPVPKRWCLTNHEKLEAMVFLRDWLRGKASDEAADELLSIQNESD